MAAKSRRERVFEELGLLKESEPSHPYAVLGLDQAFANELLAEDPSGEVVRLAASALHKVLAKRYHPDVPGGNPDRFREIQEAGALIKDASPALLARWSKKERVQESPNLLKRVQEERETLVSRSAEMFQTALEEGNNPLHFSQLEWAQGVLLQRASSSLLLRQLPHGGVQIRKARKLNIGATKEVENTQAFDFSLFLRQNELFGLEPGTDIIAYIDDQRRASILASDLTFLMDVTDPVADHRKRRARFNERQRVAVGPADLWSRSDDPILFLTRVPHREDSADQPGGQVFAFPRWQSLSTRSGRDMQWNLPMEVAGTVADPHFASRARYTRATGATAIHGGETRQTINLFSLVSVPPRKFIEDEPGYSPLLAGGSLVLYDTTNKMPVVTNAKVLGMLGHDSQRA